MSTEVQTSKNATTSIKKTTSKNKKRPKAPPQKKRNESILLEFNTVELKNFYFLVERIAHKPHSEALKTYSDLKDHQETISELRDKLKYAEIRTASSEESDVLRKLLDLMSGPRSVLLEDKNLFSGREHDTLDDLKYKLRSILKISKKPRSL